ncbi:MAG TPA: VTC domain-containing protein [Kofleriaceae bacterium]|nr:VTC domain-containing protein [Kofleriaceae bacterium]
MNRTLCMRLPRHTLDPYADVSPVLQIGRAEVEHKFLVEADEAARFAAIVSERLAEEVFDRQRPVSHVVTTYFDTDDRRLFQAGADTGLGRVRVRQYAAAATPDGEAAIGQACAFELKEATGESRRKARIVATPADIDRLLYQGGWMHDSHTSAVSEMPLFRAASAIGSGVLRPTLTTTFRRRAWVGPEIRVTLDEGVLFAAPAGLRQPGDPAAPHGVYSRLPQRVIEVKLGVSLPAWLAAAMRGRRLATRFSKYRDGLLAAQRIEALAAAARSAPFTSRTPRITVGAFEHEPSRTGVSAWHEPTRA